MKSRSDGRHKMPVRCRAQLIVCDAGSDVRRRYATRALFGFRFRGLSSPAMVCRRYATKNDITPIR